MNPLGRKPQEEKLLLNPHQEQIVFESQGMLGLDVDPWIGIGPAHLSPKIVSIRLQPRGPTAQFPG